MTGIRDTKQGFAISGGDTGILLLHGYTATPLEVSLIGEFLANKGMRVVAPLLPGHGTTPKDLNTRTWRELADFAANELYELQSRCSRVYVGGLSMGALLTLHLGQHCSGITGLIPMAPALYLSHPLRFLVPVLKYVLPTIPKRNDSRMQIHDPTSAPFLWHYDRTPLRFADQVMSLMHHVRDRLSQLTQPLLVFHGEQDRKVPVKASEALIERASSEDRELVLLQHSGHSLVVDGERDQVFSKTWQWIQMHANSTREHYVLDNDFESVVNT